MFFKFLGCIVLFLALGGGLGMDVEAGKRAVWPHDQLVLHDAVSVLNRCVGPLLADPPSGAGVSLPDAALRVASPW